MKLVIDMNLSPRWVPFLEAAGYEAVHWSDLGPSDAPDHQILGWATQHDHVVFTNDLDFTALLAASQAHAPSVIQLRAQDLLPDALGATVIQTLRQFESELNDGALISVDPTRARVRILPLRT